MPQPPREPASTINIRIAPDAPVAYLNDARIDFIRGHSLAFSVPISVKSVKINKDPNTGEVSIELGE